jgi:hypothetical protein
MRRVLAGTWGLFVNTCTVAVLTMALSAITFYCIEAPALRMKGRRGRVPIDEPPQKAEAPAAPVAEATGRQDDVREVPLLVQCANQAPCCRRPRHAGWKVLYFPSVTVIHHESKFRADVPERRINEMWRWRHRYWHKHHAPAVARLAALPTGAQYFGAATVGFFRGPAYRDSMRLHARNAWRVEGRGLRELADEWSVRRQSGDS